MKLNVSIHKVSLKHSCAPLFVYCLWLLLPITTELSSSWNPSLLSGQSQKPFADR